MSASPEEPLVTLPAYEGVLDLFRKGAVVEALEQFTALHENALVLQQNATSHRNSIHALKSEPGESDRLESDGKAYYRVENGKRTGPFCQRCYDAESRLERLRALDVATYGCLACKMECKRILCG